METAEKELLTVAEMASSLGYSKKSFYNLADDMKPPAIKRSGRAWRYRRSTFKDWLDQQEAKSGIRLIKIR